MFLDDDLDEECEYYLSNSKSSASGCCLAFAWFLPGVAYKSGAYKKKKEQISTRYFRENVYFDIIVNFDIQVPFVYKTMSQISFNLFCSGDKRYFPQKLMLISRT